MILRRIHNPAQLTSEELKASFVVRHETLADLLRLLREQVSGRPCQHVLLVGPRGMGKTTLGLRFLQAIDETPDLATVWQPVAFHEESYHIIDLADFWLAALHHLTRATQDPQWADQAEALERDERDAERLAAYALAALLDFCQANGKRLALFIDNLDLVFAQLRDERDMHALRASLIEHPEILLVGSAHAVFDAIRNHGKPFYEFFRLFILQGLGRDECRRIFEALAENEGRTEISERLNLERGRLETVSQLTGGNPRLLVLTCRMLIESPLVSAFEDLERLIDEQTPYFKARIEELPVQARKVFHCLAERWTPMLARELSVAARLSSSHASAQLRQLVEKGYAKEVQLAREKRVRYEVGDRFYNLYYLLRFSRTGRDRLERLVAFLHDLFGSTSMRFMYPATLAALQARGFPPEEMSDWIGILAGYVAEDSEFAGRDDWRRLAIDMVRHVIGIHAPVLGEIDQAFASPHSSCADRLTAPMSLYFEWVAAGRLAEAERMCRKGIREAPDDADGWMRLGTVLIRQERFEEAQMAFQRAAEQVSLEDATAWLRLGWELLERGRFEEARIAFEWMTEHRSLEGPEWRVVALAGWAGQSIVFFKTGQIEAATAAVEQMSGAVDPDDPPSVRALVTWLFRSHGDALARMGQQDSAIHSWQRVLDYVRPGDPPTTRRQAAQALHARSEVLAELGRYDEALSTWERVTEYVHVGDPRALRVLIFEALFAKGKVLWDLKRGQEAIAAWRRSSEYIHPDDPIEVRHAMADLLSLGGEWWNALGKYDDSESTCRRATDIEPTCSQAWRVLAKAILGQNGDDAHLREAEACARRAVELAPEDADALQTLSEVLAHRGHWPEALEQLERALHTGDVRKNRERLGLTALLIQLVAAGYGARVKRLMEEAGLVDSMEPLWHAVRADLGEALEPLPAEIMDTVTDLRQKFVEESYGSGNSMRGA